MLAKDFVLEEYANRKDIKISKYVTSPYILSGPGEIYCLKFVRLAATGVH